jgi:hypothetical protein
MRTTRIQFSDFWDRFDPRRNIWVAVLERLAIPHEVVDESPDLLICSVFGMAWATIPARKKLFYAGENWYRMDEKTPLLGNASALESFDMVYSFDYNDSANHYRVPLYLIDSIATRMEDYSAVLRNKGKDQLYREFQQRKFCTFVQGNKDCPFRNQFLHRLSAVERVDCHGELFNNTGTIVDRRGKIEVTRDYKFALAFENSEYAGYVTEKLVDAFKSDVLPIYWGGTRVHEEFNEQAFVNVNTLGESQALRLVEEMRNDFDLYWQYYRQPIVAADQVPIRDRIERFYAHFREFVRSAA